MGCAEKPSDSVGEGTKPTVRAIDGLCDGGEGSCSRANMRRTSLTMGIKGASLSEETEGKRWCSICT